MPKKLKPLASTPLDDAVKALGDIPSDAANPQANGARQRAQVARDSAVKSARDRCRELQQEIAQLDACIRPTFVHMQTATAALQTGLKALSESPEEWEQSLKDCYRALGTLIRDFNKTLPRALREAITRAAQQRAGNLWTTARCVDDRLQEGIFLEMQVRFRVDDESSLLAPGAAQRVLGEVDEILRRWQIFHLGDRCMNMVFTERVNRVRKASIATGSFIRAWNDVERLRLNPDIGEWREALRIPKGKTLYIFWRETATFDNKNVHVTISKDAIKDPGNLANYTSGQALFDALFLHPNVNMRVHGTLTVEVSGRSHPKIFVGNQERRWVELERLYVSEGETPQDAKLKAVAAKMAVRTLLTKFENEMVRACDTVLANIKLGKDIQGNSYKP
ncbi:hypothetical protein [Nannocystis pusilla]|uniref:hypothetical protein n=1 Tax=Nannocystis pusilla TaxID=889268 RepID=UPI003DA2AA6D